MIKTGGREVSLKIFYIFYLDYFLSNFILTITLSFYRESNILLENSHSLLTLEPKLTMIPMALLKFLVISTQIDFLVHTSLVQVLEKLLMKQL